MGLPRAYVMTEVSTARRDALQRRFGRWPMRHLRAPPASSAAHPVSLTQQRQADVPLRPRHPIVLLRSEELGIADVRSVDVCHAVDEEKRGDDMPIAFALAVSSRFDAGRLYLHHSSFINDGCTVHAGRSKVAILTWSLDSVLPVNVSCNLRYSWYSGE